MRVIEELNAAPTLVRWNHTQRAFIERRAQKAGVPVAQYVREVALGAVFSAEMHEHPAAVREPV